MIPILDCGYGKFNCLLKLIKKEKKEDNSEATSGYKGNLNKKRKRDEMEKEDQTRLRNTFIHPD